MGAPSSLITQGALRLLRVPSQGYQHFSYDLKVCLKLKLYEGTLSGYNLLRMSKQPHVPAFFGRIHPDLRAPDW